MDAQPTSVVEVSSISGDTAVVQSTYNYLRPGYGWSYPNTPGTLVIVGGTPLATPESGTIL
jgi:hypothetical protein